MVQSRRLLPHARTASAISCTDAHYAGIRMAQMPENYSVTLSHGYSDDIIHPGMTWDLLAYNAYTWSDEGRRPGKDQKAGAVVQVN